MKPMRRGAVELKAGRHQFKFLDGHAMKRADVKFQALPVSSTTFSPASPAVGNRDSSAGASREQHRLSIRQSTLGGAACALAGDLASSRFSLPCRASPSPHHSTEACSNSRRAGEAKVFGVRNFGVKRV